MEKGVSCYDYMEEETIAVKNAVATAEGAIAEAISFFGGDLVWCKSVSNRIWKMV